MKLVAAIAAALLLSACASETTHPEPSSPSSGTSANSTPPPAGSGLDCAGPSTDTERLVCGNAQLIDLDHRLQTAYQQALATAGTDTTALTTAQNSWATQRDACAHHTNPSTCLQEAYQTRLLQLAIADPATTVPPVVDYRCSPEYSPLTAQFYNQFDPPSAVLNWKGDQLILFVHPSGSGARYGRQSLGHWEYWEHQGEVTLDFDGTKFVCHTH